MLLYSFRVIGSCLSMVCSSISPEFFLSVWPSCVGSGFPPQCWSHSICDDPLLFGTVTAQHSALVSCNSLIRHHERSKIPKAKEGIKAIPSRWRTGIENSAGRAGSFPHPTVSYVLSRINVSSHVSRYSRS